MSYGKTPTGVILAGGASRRMGSDKASLVVDGRPLVVRVCDALWEAGCQPVVCQGGDAEMLASFGLEVKPDSEPGAGPVAAIRDAMVGHEGTIVVSACDLPDLDADSVRAVIRASEIGASVSVAAHGGRRHLLSCWPAEQLRSVTDAISAGVTSYGGLLDQVGAVEVPVDAGAVRNVNGPDDLG